MPNKEQNSVWWNRLLLHEYDHVAVSMDERPLKLVSFLTADFVIENISINSKADITDTFIDEEINKQINVYENMVEQLIKLNYELLDKKSEHGLKKIEDRQAFFDYLYSHEHLKKIPFKYFDTVSDYLNSEEYKLYESYYIMGQ